MARQPGPAPELFQTEGAFVGRLDEVGLCVRVQGAGLTEAAAAGGADIRTLACSGKSRSVLNVRLLRGGQMGEETLGGQNRHLQFSKQTFKQIAKTHGKKLRKRFTNTCMENVKA